MGIAGLELMRNSIDTLVEAWGYHHYPVLNMTPLTIGILVASVGTKICLFIYSSSLARLGSGTALALSGMDGDYSHTCSVGPPNEHGTDHVAFYFYRSQRITGTMS